MSRPDARLTFYENDFFVSSSLLIVSFFFWLRVEVYQSAGAPIAVQGGDGVDFFLAIF